MSAIHPITANTPGILDFLREFRREVFDGHDIFTVGDANGVNPEELPAWVGTEGVFDMLFEFSHMNLPLKNGETWCRPTWWKLPDLKRGISTSQDATKENGWCPVFFENHDQPRCVNHFVAPGANTFRAAKVIAAVLLTLRGTPFIYEGQELGMENVTWDSIDRYNDISSRGQYEFALQEGFTPEQARQRPDAHAMGRQPERQLHRRHAVAARARELSQGERGDGISGRGFRPFVVQDAFRPPPATEGADGGKLRGAFAG